VTGAMATAHATAANDCPALPSYTDSRLFTVCSEGPSLETTRTQSASYSGGWVGGCRTRLGCRCAVVDEVTLLSASTISCERRICSVHRDHVYIYIYIYIWKHAALRVVSLVKRCHPNSLFSAADERQRQINDRP